jgi:hypothetical protein
MKGTPNPMLNPSANGLLTDELSSEVSGLIIIAPVLLLAFGKLTELLPLLPLLPLLDASIRVNMLVEPRELILDSTVALLS